MSAKRDRIGSRRSLLARAGWLSLLSLPACDGGEHIFTEHFTTDHFVYFLEEGADPPCEGTAQWLERYYQANVGFLGAPLPFGGKIQYHRIRDSQTLVDYGCPPDAQACAPETTIYATAPIHPHEIVHANAAVLGQPPSLFQEGLAEVLGCTLTSDADGPIDTSAPIELLVETDLFVGHRAVAGADLYDEAMSFVRYLIDEVGQARFLSFYAHAPQLGSRAEIEAVFLVEMGVSLDAAFADWRKRPPLHHSALCLRRMECDPSMPALVPGELTLGCGPSGLPLAAKEALFRFEVPEDRMMVVTTEPAATEPQALSTIGFYRCSGGDALGYTPPTASFLSEREVALDPSRLGYAFALDVPPGAYTAWLSAPGEARVDVAAEPRRSPMRGADCQPAEEPLVLDHTHQTMLASRWVDRPCQGPWCPGHGWDVAIGAKGGALEAQALFGGDGTFTVERLYICSDLCPAEASACEVLDLSHPGAVKSKQTFAPGAVVHVGAPQAGHFLIQLRVAP